MKKAAVLLFILAIAIGLSASNLLVRTLPNGMSVVIKQNTQNPTVGISCFVKTGSMHEGKYLGSGISHFVEHVASGGTTSRRTESDYIEINKLIGASANAYTNTDRTAYHCVIGKEYFSEALGTISEYVQYCVFDSSEVTRERQVISKEIILGMAQPLSKLFMRYEEAFMPKSTGAYPVIGYPELFNKLTRQDLVDYYRTRYVPNNMVLVVVGDIDPAVAIQEVEVAFSGFPRGNLEPVYQPGQDFILGSREVIEEFDVLQPMVMVSQLIPNGDIRDVFLLNAGLELLLNKESSPIQKKLQQELKLVRYIYGYSMIDRVENSATLNIRFEAARTEDIPRILDILYKEFSPDRKKSFVTQKMLNNMIAKYESQRYLVSRAVEDECEAIGDAMLDYGVPDVEQMGMEIMYSMKPAEIDAVIRKYLNPRNKFTFYGLPIGESAKLKASSSSSYARSELAKTDLGNGLSLIHKQNSEYPVVRGNVFIPVSNYYETAENYRIMSFMTNLLQKGSKKYSKDTWTDWLDDHSVTLHMYNDSDGINIMFTCLTRDLPQILKMIEDAVKNPLFSEAEIALLKSDWEGNAKRAQSFAQTPHADFRSASVYASPRECIGNMEEVEIYNRFTRQDVMQAFKKYLKAESMIVAIVGDQTAAQAAAVARSLFDMFEHSRIDDAIKPPVLRLANASYTQKYAFEHAFVDFTMACPGTDDPDYIVMKAIDALLNYGDRRLHYATRVVRDLAYYASAYNVSAPGYGMFRVSSQSSADKISELTQVLEQEIERLINEPISPQELTEAVDNYLMQHQNDITDEWLGYYAIDFEVQGLGYDLFLNGASILKQVSPADIQRVAARYMARRDVTISVPSADVQRIMPEQGGR